jgi:hypothetical protein
MHPFYRVDNNTDNAIPAKIIRYSTVLNQKALDALLATEYIGKRGEKGETYYTRTERSAESTGSLEAREQSARSRGAGLHVLGRKPLPSGPGEMGRSAGQEHPQLTFGPDLSPTSPVVSAIREGLPGIQSVQEAQGAAMFAKLLAAIPEKFDNCRLHQGPLHVFPRCLVLTRARNGYYRKRAVRTLIDTIPFASKTQKARDALTHGYG